MVIPVSSSVDAISAVFGNVYFCVRAASLICDVFMAQKCTGGLLSQTSVVTMGQLCRVLAEQLVVLVWVAGGPGAKRSGPWAATQGSLCHRVLP